MEYAERVLGVHDRYEEAKELLLRYKEARQRMTTASTSLRTAREELADFEADFATTVRAENPKISATAFDRMLKVLLQQNDDHREQRRQIIQLQNDLDLAESEVKSVDRQLDVIVARLHELAGLLQFYGARSSRPTS